MRLTKRQISEILDKYIISKRKINKIAEKISELSDMKVCPNCNRTFEYTEVPSGIFCCSACEHGIK